MKILYLVVILSFIHCCLGASNRTTVWFLSSNQIYSSNKQFEACSLSGTLANPADPPTATSITLLTTSKLTVSGTLVALESNVPTTFISSTALLGSISIIFNYNTSHYLTLSLNTPATSLSTSLDNILTSTVTSAVLVATPTSFPIVITNNQVLSPVGTTWLSFVKIQELSVTGGPTAASGILITDFLTSTTFAILQFDDNVANAGRNSFYQIAIRTLTSSITGTNLLTAGCGASGRKRSVDHMLQKRYLSTCPTTSLDSSLTSTTISSLCSNAASLYAADLGTGLGTDPTKSVTPLTDAVIRAVNGINALYISDIGYFSAASSQFSTGVIKFSTMIAMASFILNSIY